VGKASVQQIQKSDLKSTLAEGWLDLSDFRIPGTTKVKKRIFINNKSEIKNEEEVLSKENDQQEDSKFSTVNFDKT